MLERSAERRRPPSRAPRIDAGAGRVAQSAGQPVADRQTAVRARFPQQVRRAEVVALDLPARVDGPHARKCADARRREGGRNPRPVTPPSPTRGPQLALTSESWSRERHLAVDAGAN